MGRLTGVAVIALLVAALSADRSADDSGTIKGRRMTTLRHDDHMQRWNTLLQKGFYLLGTD
jgi:hypothetical protein